MDADKRRNRIRIGNQTSFSAPFLFEPFEYAIENAFDAFEWFPDKKESGEGWSESDLDGESRSSIKKRAFEHDIALSVHGSWQANPLVPANRGILLDQARFAHDIGASLLVTHLYLGEGVKSYVHALAPLMEGLREKGIRLAIENTPLTPPESLNDLFALLRAGGGEEGVGMCLDLGHANLCEATRNDYLLYMDRLDPRVPIIHIHLHENEGDSDSHLPLFTGPAGKDPSGIQGFIQRVKKRGFSGNIILEQWPRPPELLKAARTRLTLLLGETQRDNRRASSPAEHSPPDFMGLLVQGNEKSRSWREKLAFVHELLTDEAMDLDPEKLTYLAIYLRFVGTGEIPTREEGGHHRPSHHARTAGRIHARLAEIARPENRFILRRIYPWLPSFRSDFTRAEPLTRIRDIAHRDDIPQDLKQEIKHTLQNKLHGNAGPEDLATSENLLEKITAPGSGYPEPFIHEFMKFHEELKEFFHARSLEQDLSSLSSQGEERGDFIHRFLDAKKKGATRQGLVGALEALTALRDHFARDLQKSDPQTQAVQMADIRLEDYAFVLLSRLADSLDPKEDDWGEGLRSLGLSLAGLRLSGYEEEECLAVERELEAWSKDFRDEIPEDLLRLKSTIDRILRLAAEYSDRILAIFSEKVEALGGTLGVPDHAVRVYGEAEIRRNPVFQVSKIASLYLKEIRERCGLPPWDRIVPGKASGLLVHSPDLSSLAERGGGPIVALIERVEGDEEIPEGVVGLIVPHEVPHLSHLAVRARQRSTVFVVCEEPELFRSLRELAGKWLLLDAETEDLRVREISPIEEKGESPEGKKPPWHGQGIYPPSFLRRRILPLAQVTPETGGSKAFGARRLEALSQVKGADFTTPPGVVVPFGVPEEALALDRKREKVYLSLVEKVDSLSGRALEDLLGELRERVRGIRVPDRILSGLEKSFRENDLLMVRSSSNCEDLEKISGAGLYESVAAVRLPEVAHAIREVWASIWTRRAVLSRRSSGIPHGEAHMAVLIQRMVFPELSFVLHTLNPLRHDADQVYMELAVGLGETLVSGRTPGAPYRMTYDKKERKVRILSFANFSKGLWPDPPRGTKERRVDYSTIRLSVDPEFRRDLVGRLGRIGDRVETAFGSPQDIEGAFSEETIYLVQTRPQQGGWR